MSQVIKLIGENSNYTDETKNVFIQLWSLLKEDSRSLMEKKLSKKPELVDKILNTIDQKRQAISMLNTSQFDEIIKLEEEILAEI